jgi:hypothetical protein
MISSAASWRPSRRDRANAISCNCSMRRMDSPLGALLPDDFDRAMGVNRDGLRNAAQEETIHPAATM